MGKFKFPTSPERFANGSLLLIAEAWVRSGTFYIAVSIEMGYVLPGVAFCWVGPQYFVAITQAFWNSHFQVVGAEMRPLACRAGSQSLQLDLAHSLEWLPQRQLSCLSSLAPTGHSPRCVLSGRSRLSFGGAVLRRTRSGGAQL